MKESVIKMYDKVDMMLERMKFTLVVVGAALLGIGLFRLSPFGWVFEKPKTQEIEVTVTDATANTIDLTDENNNTRTFCLPEKLQNVYHKNDKVYVKSIFDKDTILVDDISRKRNENCIYISVPDSKEKAEICNYDWKVYTGAEKTNDYILYEGNHQWRVNGSKTLYGDTEEMKFQNKLDEAVQSYTIYVDGIQADKDGVSLALKNNSYTINGAEPSFKFDDENKRLFISRPETIEHNNNVIIMPMN